MYLFFCCSVAQAQEKKEYVIGLTEQGIRGATIQDVELGFNYQLENLTKNKKYSMKLKVFKADEQLINMFLDAKLFGYFGTPLLALKYPKEFNLDSLFVPVLNDKVLQRYVVLVRKDSNINRLDDLKNKAISYCISDELGLIFLQRQLKQLKFGNIDSFFSKVTVKKNPNVAISTTFFKESQATIVLEADFIVASELNPQLKAQLISIETSPEYVINILAVSNKSDTTMPIDEYEDTVLSIGGTVQSKKLLKKFNFGRLRKIKNEDLNSVRALVSDLNGPDTK